MQQNGIDTILKQIDTSAKQSKVDSAKKLSAVKATKIPVAKKAIADSVVTLRPFADSIPLTVIKQKVIVHTALKNDKKIVYTERSIFVNNILK